MHTPEHTFYINACMSGLHHKYSTGRLLGCHWQLSTCCWTMRKNYHLPPRGSKKQACDGLCCRVPDAVTSCDWICCRVLH